VLCLSGLTKNQQNTPANHKNMSFLFLLLSVAMGEEAGSLTGITRQHNFYRCLHGSPFLIWDDDLQASARAWAEVRAGDNCVNLPSGRVDVGENMLWSHAVSRAGTTTADAWYQNNSPQAYQNPTISDIYATFNQVVWKSSLKLGCHVVTCPQDQDELVVCHYSPAGNQFTDVDAKANIGGLTRLVPECQTIADAHDAGMFVSTQTDETNPAALAIGAGIGAISVIVVGFFLFKMREAWFKWTSARLANQQPLVMAIVEICLQITIFALMVRAIDSSVPWCTLPDGSTLNPTQVCMQRTANSVPGASCTPFAVSAICSHEYQCNAVEAAATAQIFVILACVLSWINLAVQTGLAIPKIPLEPRLGASIAVASVLGQIVFVWLTLWFYGGYIISYFSLNGFAMAAEGSIEMIVTLPLFFPTLVIASAQMTLHTK